MLQTVSVAASTEEREVPFSPTSVSGSSRLRAQQYANGTKRRHFLRAVRRVTTLLLLDSAVLLGARQALHFLRAHPASAGAATTLFPEGFMGGWGSMAALIVGLMAMGGYASEERWVSGPTVFRGVALGSALAMWQSIDSSGVLWTASRWAIVFAVAGALLMAARRLLWLGVIRYRNTTHPIDNVLLVGDPTSQSGAKAAKTVANRLGMDSVGWLSERGDLRDYSGHPSAVWEVLCETGTDTVLLCGDLDSEMFDSVVEAAAVAGCRVLSVPSSEAPLTASRPRVLGIGSTRLHELTFPASRAGQDALKRLIDIVGSALLFVVFSPLFAITALWIKLDSRGSIFFVQERVGQAGRVFPMWKFRTMEEGADTLKDELAALNASGDPRLFKIPNDPRITTAGAFLRRWSLDELPQLWNVLRGDMSLVGPRPFFESDLAAYDDHHFIRLTVKPGLTGLWQVRGRSSIVNFEEVVQMDREYVENWSLRLDLTILLATFPAVLRRTGAY